MLFYLVKSGTKITKDTVLKAYDLPIQEYGTLRKTLCIGDVVEIKEGLVKIMDYNYSYIHNKGVHEYTSLDYYSSIRKEELDIKGVE